METENPDIRSAVDRSRGLLKKIQLLIPGYRGYRQLEDLRAADELLRNQISVILQQALNALQSERLKLVNDSEFEKLNTVGSGISRVQQFQGELLHSQQGYSGISPTIRVDQAKLTSLYDYDLKFLEISEHIRQLCDFSNSGNIADSLSTLTDELNNARVAWEARISAVEKILLSPGAGK